MSTLIIVSALGFICLLLEILNLRKILVPVTLLGLVAAIGITVSEYVSGGLLIPSDSHNMIVSTGYSQGFSILFTLLAIFIIALSPEFYKSKIEHLTDYVSIKVFLLAGAIAMVSFGNLTTFFIGLEVLSIGGYILAASSPESRKSNEAGMKYFLMGAFASGFIVFGIALIYGGTATLDTGRIWITLRSGVIFPVWFYAGVVMVLIGMFFKASLFPFHFWAPDVYDGAPNLVTALMSTLVKVAAIGALCKIATLFIVDMSPSLEVILMLTAILSMTVANITALRQTNVKRMMAYSGISHAGFMSMALLRTDLASNGVLYYAAAYSLAAMAAFAVILAVSKSKGGEDISYFEGLSKTQPVLAGVLALAMLSLGGIPIMGGFFAKLFTFNDMLNAGHISLVIFGVINSVIAVYYYFSVINVMYTKENTGEKVTGVATEYKVVAISAITLNILLGIFASVVMNMNLIF